MHVAQVIDNLNSGGAQTMQVILAKNICQFNVKLTLISLNRTTHNTTTQQELEALGVRVLFFPPQIRQFMFGPLRIFNLARFMRREQFDVVHTHLTYGNIIGIFAANLAGIPTVATLHNAINDKSANFYSIRDPLETLVLRKFATRILAVGQATANVYRERLSGRVIQPIPSAVSIIPPLSDAERIQTRTELMGDPNRPLIISVGRLAPQKGYDDLLNAFATVHQKYPAAILVIAGGGVLQDSLAAQVKQLGLENHAILLGRRTDVPRLLASSDLFVSSSLWEGLPIAVLEAMAAGLPIVATSVSDTPNIVREDIGKLVPPQNPIELAKALSYYLDNSDKLKSAGGVAKAYIVQNHDPEQWAKKYLALYESAKSNPIKL